MNTTSPDGGRLTKAQADALAAIVRRGPSCFRPTNQNREQAHVRQLFERGLIERLNRMRPGPTVYEITPAGRAALDTQR